MEEDIYRVHDKEGVLYARIRVCPIGMCNEFATENALITHVETHDLNDLARYAIFGGKNKYESEKEDASP